MTGLGLATVLLRHVAWSLVVPLSPCTPMSDIVRNGFARVQRFFDEWHANTFSGSTVRKISRGMWRSTGSTTTLLLSLLPALVVLVGTALVLGLHWPALGATVAIGAGAYIGANRPPRDPRHRARGRPVERPRHPPRRAR